MVKEFEEKVENYSDIGAYSKYGIKEEDFINLIKKQLEDFDFLEKSESKQSTYINSKDARSILYCLHSKICEIKGITK